MNFQDTNPEDNTEKKQNEGFFANLIASLFKSNNPEAEKKRKLKIIAKNLSKTKFRLKLTKSSIEYFGNLNFKPVVEGEHDSAKPKEVIEMKK